MKTFKNTIAIILISIITFSCSKDDEIIAPPTVTASKKLLIKEYTDNYTINYTYDTNNRLTKITKQGQFDGNPSINLGLFTFTYNTNGQLIEVLREYSGNANFAWKDKYFYSNNKLSKFIEERRNQNTGFFELYSTNNYTYISDSIFDIITFREVQSDYRTRYTVTDSNLTQLDQYDGITANNTTGTLSVSVVYSLFDSKNYIYSSFPKEYDNPSHIYKNNHAKSQSGNYIRTFNFEYDADNYTIKKTDDSGVIINYEYKKI